MTYSSPSRIARVCRGGQIAPGAGLAEELTPHVFPAPDPGQVTAFLGLRPVGDDGPRGEVTGAYGSGRPRPDEFFYDDDLAEGVRAGGATPLRRPIGTVQTLLVQGRSPRSQHRDVSGIGRPVTGPDTYPRRPGRDERPDASPKRVPVLGRVPGQGGTSTLRRGMNCWTPSKSVSSAPPEAVRRGTVALIVRTGSQ